MEEVKTIVRHAIINISYISFIKEIKWLYLQVEQVKYSQTCEYNQNLYRYIFLSYIIRNVIIFLLHI